MSPPCGKTVDSENADQAEARSALPTYIGTPFIKIKEYRENVQECVCHQEANGFFLETKLLINHSGSGKSHISIRTEHLVREEGYETLGLAGARHRLGDHPVHVKSTAKRFLRL
ncbi:MAG: hypothetical protein ABI618_06010 [Nitrospirota bacterium]